MLINSGVINRFFYFLEAKLAMWVKGIFAAKNASLNLLGTKGTLKWENTDEGVTVFIPEKIRKSPPCSLAWTVKISEVQ